VRLQFTKMEAAGNDFVVIDRRELPSDAIGRLVRAVCDRKRGVGADGLISLDGADDVHKFRVHYFNSDGSHAAVCLNAFRCVAVRAKALGWSGDEFTFETDVGNVTVGITSNGVDVMVPPPSYARVELPSWAPCPIGYYVWTGDPHLVVLKSGLAESPDTFLRDAQRLRWWKGVSGEGQNVHFLTRDESQWAIRSYERGIEGETLACGSGSLAAASVLRHVFGAVTSVAFRTYGGCILIVRQNEASWIVSGPARHVYEGTFIYELGKV
jgi:diaminopimelate epimerase